MPFQLRLMWYVLVTLYKYLLFKGNPTEYIFLNDNMLMTWQSPSDKVKT